MTARKELTKLLALLGILGLAFYMPVGNPRFDSAVLEGLRLLRWYAREHVLLCLVPAFFIAGAIAVFLSQDAVMRYLGAGASRLVAYAIGSVSGAVLAVCSCTVLPLFASIWQRGAGLGPAVAFLYSGPAINVLAIIFTARVLGVELGAARAVGAILFSVTIGLIMEALFRTDRANRRRDGLPLPQTDSEKPLAHSALYLALMIAILVFANWGRPPDPHGALGAIYAAKWQITAALGAAFALATALYFRIAAYKVAIASLPTIVLAALVPNHPVAAFTAGVTGLTVLACTEAGDLRQWLDASWAFAKQILPLLFIGVFLAGILLGTPGREGLVPARWVNAAVGGNSLRANFFASIAGALMYFATLTEVPIVEGLLRSGMGKGPALALLLAGPAVSLPNMLVIRSILGTKRTAAYIGLVIVMATFSGLVYGAMLG